jgi:hypothetical protein
LLLWLRLTGTGRIGGKVMLRQLHQLTIPTAISIAFFDATFFAIAHVFGFSGREVFLGVCAGAAGGMYVLAAVLWHGTRDAADKAAQAVPPIRDIAA